MESENRRSSSSGGGQSQRRLVEYFLIVKPIERDRSAVDDHSYVSSSSGGAAAEAKRPSYSNDDHYGDFRNSTVLDAYLQRQDVVYQPVITGRYPLRDHEDNPLQESVVSFCHPTGNIVPRKGAMMPKVSHVFGTMFACFGSTSYQSCILEVRIAASNRPTQMIAMQSRILALIDAYCIVVVLTSFSYHPCD